MTGIVSPAYWVLRPRQGHLDSLFCHYLMRSRPTLDSIARVSKFQPPAQYDVLWSDFRAIRVWVPSVPNQILIARFLSDVDQRVGRFIGAKKKLIALLNEETQAIIHRAVTRGIEPRVELQPSGVQSLGDVPAHWQIKRLKCVSTVQTGVTLGKTY